MDKATNRKIIDFISDLRKENGMILKAFLFGSYAKNTNRTDSDIDIAFVVEDIKDDEKFDLQVQLLLLSSKYDSRIEPHIISKDDLNSNDPFVAEILNAGIEIDINKLNLV